MAGHLSRRRFMYGVAGVAGATFVGPHIMRAAEPNKDKVRIAFVGTGGQGGSHLHLAEKDDNKKNIVKNHICPAFCEVDKGRWDKIKKIAPDAQAFTDYRKMLEKHEKDIDAVCTAIPDHSHACVSMLALQMGKACYTEKPLTWSVGEARALAEISGEKKLPTQMGNMGHANEGNRRVVEMVRAGIIGDILEVHTWTNRPVWAQGIKTRPASKPVPPNLDWESWIGPAPMREYHDGLHSFGWRGWLEFGCGAVGDMGCHTWDNVFWAMNPDYPTEVELMEIVNPSTETYPSKSKTRWLFPEKNGRPAFKAFWYEGGLKPEAPEEFMTDPVRQKKGKDGNPETPKLPGSGNLYIGTKGKFLVEGDYADSGPRLLPDSKMKEVKLEKSIPRSPGHKNEWIMAILGTEAWDFPKSAFHSYAGPLTEVQLLAAMAIRMGQVGSKIECDPVKRTIKTRAVLEWANRKYREGWPQVSPRSAIA